MTIFPPSAALVLFAAAAVSATAAPAAAQSRFSLELDAGFALPLSPSVHSAVSLEPRDAANPDVGIPRLADRLNAPGFQVGVTALVSTLEIRYRLERFGWRGARVECVGDREARGLPNGEIEDAEVRYDCSIPSYEIELPGEQDSALAFHHLSVGPRFYLRRPERVVLAEGVATPRDRTRLYAIPAGGLTLARYQDPNLGRQLKAGVNLSAGGGAEFPLDRRMAISVDLRYTLSLVGGSSSPASRAGRAIADERNVAAALLDTFHRVAINLGFRFDFR